MRAQISNFKIRVTDKIIDNSPEQLEMKKTKSEKIKPEGKFYLLIICKFN